MPTAPSASQAFAPIDISGTYGKVADTMVGAGQVVNKAMDDWSKFEKERDKEKLRLQALTELKQTRPYLFATKAVTENTSLSDLGRGLYQMGATEVLYKRIADAKGTPPDPNTMEKALAASFAISEKGYDDFYKIVAKQAEELEKQAGVEKGAQKVGEVLKSVPPNATKQDIARGVAESGVVTTPEQNALVLASGQDADKLAAIEQRKRAAEARLKNKEVSDRADRELAEWLAGSRILGENFDQQKAIIQLTDDVAKIRSDAAAYAATKGISTEEAQQRADELEQRIEYMRVNRQAFQDFAAAAQKRMGEKFNIQPPPSGSGGGTKQSPEQRYGIEAKKRGWPAWNTLSPQKQQEFIGRL